MLLRIEGADWGRVPTDRALLPKERRRLVQGQGASGALHNLRITCAFRWIGVCTVEVSPGDRRNRLEETQPSQPLQNDVISLDGGQYYPYAIQLQVNTSDRVGRCALSEPLLRVDNCCQIRPESIHDLLGLKCGKGNFRRILAAISQVPFVSLGFCKEKLQRALSIGTPEFTFAPHLIALRFKKMGTTSAISPGHKLSTIAAKLQCALLAFIITRTACSSCPSCFQRSPSFHSKTSLDLSCVKSRLHGASHVFVSDIETKSALCVPQKNGNIFWSLLLHKVYDPKTTFQLPKKVGQGFQKKLELIGKKKDKWHDWLEGSAIPRFMIVRNPYIRLLSGYLDKIHHDAGRKKFSKTFKFPAPSNFESFAVWLAWYLKDRDRAANPKDFYVRHLFMPQSYHCLLPCGVNYTVVKDEKSFNWYPCFLDVFNLKDAAKSGWGSPPCFLAKDGECNTDLWLDTNCERSINLTTSGKVHSKHTEMLLEEHYTPTAARIVTSLFKGDLEHFGYQAWDGKIENFERGWDRVKWHEVEKGTIMEVEEESVSCYTTANSMVLLGMFCAITPSKPAIVLATRRSSAM